MFRRNYAPQLVHDSLNGERKQFYPKFKLEENLNKSQNSSKINIYING